MISRRIGFTVFGKPRPQAQNRTAHVYEKGPDGRPRPRMVLGRDGRLRPLTVHPNPPDTVNWRSDAKSAALQAMKVLEGELLDGPLRMDVDIFVERPKRLIWTSGRRPMPAILTTAGCDRSNLMKTLEDALQGICYANDKQLADGRVRKFYCAGPGYGDVRPRVEVVIEEVGEEQGCRTASSVNRAELVLPLTSSAMAPSGCSGG